MGGAPIFYHLSEGGHPDFTNLLDGASRFHQSSERAHIFHQSSEGVHRLH